MVSMRARPKPKSELFLIEFCSNHHRHWGKLYKTGEVVVCLRAYYMLTEINALSIAIMACTER